MDASFSLSGKQLGDGQPSLIIAEVAQAHDGSLGLAHAFIDAIARTGADAVKFQTHIAAAESTPAEPWRVKFSPQDASRFEYWQRMEFTAEQWAELKRHADDVGLIFLSSPFSDDAVDLLENLDVPAWKIASGEVNNPLLLARILRTGKPVLLSSGMSSFADLDTAVEQCRINNVPLAVFQCTSAYPTPPERVGLNLIDELRDRYAVPIGLSDHSGTIFPSLAAATIGIQAIEVHVTMSREMFGPDVPASVTTRELRQLVEGVRFIERAREYPCDKDEVAGELEEMRKTFGKSLFLRCDLPLGAPITRECLVARKPGLGMAATDYKRVLGRKLVRAARADEPVTEEMIQHESNR